MRNLVLHLFLCGAVYAVSLSATMNFTHNFFTPESDNLPAGTYIATGLSGVIQLAEYLNGNPETKIARLLISDSTVQDVENGHGYLTGGDESREIDYWGSMKRPSLTDEEEDRREERRFSNATTALRLKRAVRDIEEPLQRVFDKAATTLEVLAYLMYINKPRDSSQYSDCTNERRDDPRIAALIGSDHSSLTQLTFRNSDIHGASRVLAHPPIFSALTHLHVARQMIDTLASLINFPRLTHLLITGAGSAYGLPAELRPRRIFYSDSGWTDRVKLFLGILGPYYRQFKPLAIPENLTVVVQPGFDPLLLGGKCGNPGIAYYEMIGGLVDAPRVPVRLLEEEDYRHGRGLIPLRRAIAEFEDQARGGGGGGGGRGSGLLRGPCLTGMSGVEVEVFRAAAAS
ncbi:hypothetical protein C8R44DRAFT_751100 [Mycena epipterygia]|nr:hypothetical protein C8R44DRAFT_751100 [Mycena epipterygia]